MNRLIGILVAIGDWAVYPLLDSTIKGTILLLLASAACWFLRRDSAATRHFVWALAVGLLVAIPVLSLVLPGWRILPTWLPSLESKNVLTSATVFTPRESSLATAENTNVLPPLSFPAPPDAEDGEPADLPTKDSIVSPVQSKSAIPVVTTAPTPAPIHWMTCLMGFWLAGCTLLASRLFAAAVMLRRSARQSQVVDQLQRLQAALVEAKLSLGLKQSVLLLLDPHRSIPIVWGLWKTRLQLPMEAEHWSVEQLQSVLLHELAHVRRKDLFVLAVTHIACVLYWFNPLVWVAAWRLHVERERACDDLVLNSGVRASAYAEHLLNVATRLTSSPWTQAYGLAMARTSSLHSRLRAVLTENRNRHKASTLLVFFFLSVGASISIPLAMLRAVDEKNMSEGQQPTNSIPSSSEPTEGIDQTGVRIDSDFEQHLDWSEPVNGLRAAVRIRSVDSPGILGLERKILLVLQNVSDKPIRFCDTGMSGGNALKEGIDKRTLYIRSNKTTLSGLSSAESTQMDVTLQPREMLALDLFRNEQPHEGRVKTGDVIAEGIVKYPNYDVSAILNLNHAPDGAWTGNLKAPPTRGAFASTGPMPQDEQGQVLFRYCVDHARLNGDIPGGLIKQVEYMVLEFLRNNTGDQYGDSYAQRMQPLMAKFQNIGDWKQSDVAALFDDIAAVTTIPLDRTMETIRENTLQRGQPLPASLNDANWGEALVGGLRMAWVLEPRETQYPFGASLRSRLVIHNSGNEPVMFVTRSFHQPEHAAFATNGAKLSIDSTFWTTRGRPEPYRLHPGEICEVHAPGIGIGARNNELDDWSNIRVGSWILAKEGDVVAFQPGEILLTSDHNAVVNPDWWEEFITERIELDTPLPVDAKEREVILFRVVSDLFGSTPTPDEAAVFLADNSELAASNLAKRLSTRTWHHSVAGPIKSGGIKFQVMPEDPDAATRPRVAMNPGRYNLLGDLRFVVTRHPVGQRLVNEAEIVWYPPGKDSVATSVPLPDGYESWAAGWAPTTTVLWVSQRGLLRSFDFARDDAVKETRYEGDQIATAPIPKDVREALQNALAKVQAFPPIPIPPAAPAATNPTTQKLLGKWQRIARSDGRIPGALLGTVRTQVETFIKQYPNDEETAKLATLLPRFDVTQDWEVPNVQRLLDEIAAIHVAPVDWAELATEFGGMQHVQNGTPLPENLLNAAWGKAAENGLRTAWVLEPQRNEYHLGSVLASRLLIHNSGQAPILFMADTWRQFDHHRARDENAREINVGSVRFTGVTPMSTFRLAPGHYVEVSGHGIGIGAGDYREELSTGSVGAWIEAKVGDTVHFNTKVRIDREGWTRPNDPKDPVALRQQSIAERIALEAPLPASEEDRKLLLTHVMNDIFGEVPSDDDVRAFVHDRSSDALLNLAIRMQRRLNLPLFEGTLETGDIVFRVLPVDPEADAKPRRAIAPGRYVLGESMQLAVQQVTTADRPGGQEVRTNSAKILFLSPDPTVESPYAPFEIKLPDGPANYAILWTRSSGLLYVIEPGRIRTIRYTDPENVFESFERPDLSTEFRQLIPESLQSAVDF